MTDANHTGVPAVGPSNARLPRIIHESAALSPDDIADDAARRADAYSHPDSEHVSVVDGFGARVAVERGHLELHDGVGEQRRVRRYAKVDAPRRVVVGIGTVGAVSFDALRWCSSVGSALVVLGQDGALLAAGPPGRNDARLIRAQALALYGPAGVETTRYLIAEKLRGQAEVLGLHLWQDAASSTVVDLMEAVNVAGSIEEIRQAEAAAANVYFAAWERTVMVNFARKDLPRVPDHWTAFNGRRSSINPGSPRSATDPAGAALNYAYKLAEIEAALAARRMGLDPSIGILHADAAGRPSFACDLMEAVRPAVDAHVLGILSGPLRKREFTEDAQGVVRCLAPITHRLAEAMPSYAVALGPVTETVAGHSRQGFALRRECAHHSQRSQAQGGRPSACGLREHDRNGSSGCRHYHQLRSNETTEAPSYQATGQPAIALEIVSWLRRSVARLRATGPRPGPSGARAVWPAAGTNLAPPFPRLHERPPWPSPSGPESSRRTRRRQGRPGRLRCGLSEWHRAPIGPRITRRWIPSGTEPRSNRRWRASPCLPSPRRRESRRRRQRNGELGEQPRISAIGLRWRSWWGWSCPRRSATVQR